MKEKRIRTLPFYLFWAWLLVLGSCATPPITGTTSSLSGEVAPNTDIIIVQPLLRIEQLHDEAILQTSNYQGNAIEAKMLAYAKNVVQLRKFVIIDPQKYSEVEVAGIFEQLCSMSPKLSVGLVSDEISILLKRLASVNERIAILVQFLQVKVSPLRGIGFSMDSSVLQASLINCRTSKVLWKNQVLTRQLPKPESKQFSKALELLYQSFPTRKEE